MSSKCVFYYSFIFTFHHRTEVMTKIKWNWQQSNWPNFTYDSKSLEQLENNFIKLSGISIGTTKHLSNSEQQELIVELVVDEALKTSEIEGEILDRDSLQSSVRREFGLTHHGRTSPAEEGIAEMMTTLYTNFAQPLTKETLCGWHKMLMSGRRNLTIGAYRTHKEVMQVVSGRYDKPKVHFEAPPSTEVNKEMSYFIDWFNKTAPGGKESLQPLTRAGIAHLHFVSIHPFEDGNGRIGRAIVEKSLSQYLDRPILTALSTTISDNKRDYYESLESQNKGNDVSEWLRYFGEIIITAQNNTIEKVDFLIKKTKFFDTHKNNLNPQQLKVVTRILKEGPKGFDGGFSAKNYISIAKSSVATTTRHLNDLVSKGIMSKTGQFKNARYTLQLPKEQTDIFETYTNQCKAKILDAIKESKNLSKKNDRER